MSIQFNPVIKSRQNFLEKNGKKFLLIVMVLFSSFLNARDYYVSPAGNNSNSGTSTSSPWQSISKVNSFNFAANDRILFLRGKTFYGGIIVKRSNLTYG